MFLCVGMRASFLQMNPKSSVFLLPDRSANPSKPWSVMKKQGDDQCHSSNRKSMKFMKVTAG